MKEKEMYEQIRSELRQDIMVMVPQEVLDYFQKAVFVTVKGHIKATFPKCPCCGKKNKGEKG
jgi:hypothetical protein